MKKIFISLLIISTLLFVPASNVSALENITTYIEERFDDGSYIEVTIHYGDLNTRSTTTHSKTATFKGEDGTKYWSVTVKGTFSYNGKTSSCTSSSVSTKNYSTTWKLSNAKASKNGATASASVTAKQYHPDGIVYRTINKTVKLTCDKNGNLS